MRDSALQLLLIDCFEYINDYPRGYDPMLARQREDLRCRLRARIKQIFDEQEKVFPREEAETKLQENKGGA